MTNVHSEVDHLYVSLNANITGRGRKGTLSTLGSLSNVNELDSAGVYFLFEPEEVREGGGPRIVRVGKTNNLRRRLQEHCGTSAFFSLIWQALAYRDRRVSFYPFLRTPWSNIPNPRSKICATSSRLLLSRTPCYSNSPGFRSKKNACGTRLNFGPRSFCLTFGDNPHPLTRPAPTGWESICQRSRQAHGWTRTFSIPTRRSLNLDSGVTNSLTWI